MTLSSLIAAASILLVAIFLKYCYSTLRKNVPLPYPPGPRPIPLLGNIFDVPDTNSWITYAEWRKSYDDLIHLQVPGTGHCLVINSEKIAIDLLEKKAKIYSDRHNTFIEQDSGMNFNAAMLPYSQSWRQNRRTFHQSFRPGAAAYFHSAEERGVHILLSNLLDTPTEFMAHAAAFTSSLTFYGIYGIDRSSQERLAQIARGVSKAMGDVLKFRCFTLPKIFPFMRYIPAWMPGGRFTLFAEECNKMGQELRDVSFDLALKQMDNRMTSLVGELVSKHRDDPEELLRIKNMAATSNLASADSMLATIESFLLAMTLNPIAQVKAQEEIDLVIGADRLPNFGDREWLPYVEAVYREVMRWNPALPLGVPHKTSESDMYHGYYIPKGAIVVTNIWAMTHDESIHDNPHAFQPERFLTGSPDAPFMSINNILAFGFGRRVCVGRYMADESLWLAIACLLATLKIAKATDENGK